MSNEPRPLKQDLIKEVDFSKGGIVPALVKDYKKGNVLMLAYMNKEALEKTIETGYTWFYSRSKDRLWNKGESSGNKQEVISLSLDCDKDAILVEVNPHGPSCHTGKESCFFNYYEMKRDTGKEKLPRDIFLYLENIIDKRLTEKPEGSYVVKLSEKGQNSILKKLGEETSELIMAVKDNDKEEVVHEASDLIFHLILSLREAGVSVDDIVEELKKRHQEKGR